MRESNIVILTGAGVSAESDLGTFRDVGGLWPTYDIADVATPEGYVRNPELVLEFYNARRADCRGADARHRGARALEINLVPSENTAFFDDRLLRPAGAMVPVWVDGLLSGSAG